jgi:hypothetical protein
VTQRQRPSGLSWAQGAIAGLVTQVGATVGEYVQPIGHLTILDPNGFIEANVPESDLDRVASPSSAAYELPHAREIPPAPGKRRGAMVYSAEVGQKPRSLSSRGQNRRGSSGWAKHSTCT